MSIPSGHRFYQFLLTLSKTAHFSRIFGSFYKSLNINNSGTRNDIKKWQTATFQTFKGLSDRTIKSFMPFALYDETKYFQG